MENILYLCGDAAALPAFSHESHGVPFCTFPLRVERLSGTSDILRVIAPAAMCRGIFPDAPLAGLYPPGGGPGCVPSPVSGLFDAVGVSGSAESPSGSAENRFADALSGGFAAICGSGSVETADGSALPGDPAAPIRVRLFGQIRSWNCRSAQGNRLQLSAWAKSLERCGDGFDNRVTLSGVLCRPPVYRCTPYGREITDVMLRVERTLPPGAACAVPWRPRCDTIPCVTWGSVARQCAALSPGDAVRFEGRFQSRPYTKTIDGRTEHRTAYEVSISAMRPPCARHAPVQPASDSAL